MMPYAIEGERFVELDEKARVKVTRREERRLAFFQRLVELGLMSDCEIILPERGVQKGEILFLSRIKVGQSADNNGGKGGSG